MRYKHFWPPSAHSLTVGLSLFMVMVMILMHGWNAQEVLAYRRELIDTGQWWRFYTGHLVHFTDYHLLMNCAGLLVISYLFLWRLSLSVLLLHWFLVPWLVGFGLYLFSPELEEYRGFSGVFYSLLMTGLLISRKDDALFAWGGIILLVGKTAYEHLPAFDDRYMLDKIGAPIAADAHLFGILVALLMYFGLWGATRWYGSRYE